MSRNGASIINRSIAAKRSGGKSSSGAMCWNPALLTRMSAVTSRPSMVARSVRSACRDRPPIESDRLGGVAVDVEDGDRGTGLGQSAGAGESDAARRPSDQGAAAGRVDPGDRRPSACRADLIRSAHFAASFPGVLVRVVAFDRARDLRPPPRSQRQGGVDSVVVKLRR